MFIHVHHSHTIHYFFAMFILMQDKTGWLSISNMDCPEILYTLDDGHWVDPGRGHLPQAGLTQWPFI
jgi:hypothetical protein